MKKILLSFFLILFFSSITQAQKFGYIDTEYILNKMPDYRKAQGEIDDMSITWQKEVQDLYKEIESLYDVLQAEEVLLTEDMKNARIEKIEQKEKEVKEYQKKVFGFEGLYFLKKKELVKPVQEKVAESVEKIAKKHKLQFIFDKSGDMVMIYTNPIHDYTDFVLEDLGLIEKTEDQED